jgi:predicted phage baseplate assembly protein
VLGPVGAVEDVFNPAAAGGGANAEPQERVAGRGPQTLRHRGRALTTADFEVMAREAAASVAVVRAIPCRSPDGRTVPGWVTLVIIPHSNEPRPWPTFELREQVRRYIEQRAAADLAAALRIYVTGPTYVAVDVDATVALVPTADAGLLERAIRDALSAFLHPLRGGPGGVGWEPGRSVYLSDVAAVLERVAGVDYVADLELLSGGVPQGEQVRVAAERTVVAGRLQINLIPGGA